jgi:hypothetical protein
MKQLCEKYLVENIAEDNVLDLLQVAADTNAYQLYSGCLKYLAFHFDFARKNIPGDSALLEEIQDIKEYWESSIYE